MSLNCWIRLNTSPSLDFLVNDYRHPHHLGHFDFTIRLLTEESVLTNEEFGNRKKLISQWTYKEISLSKPTLCCAKLNRQGRPYSMLLEWGIEARIQTELNSVEIKGWRVQELRWGNDRPSVFDNWLYSKQKATFCTFVKGGSLTAWIKLPSEVKILPFHTESGN